MDDYPLLEMMLTISWFFLLFAWITCLFTIFRDIFRSQDMSGAGKAGWTFLVIVVPLLGVLVYLIARGSSMQVREAQEAAQREQALQEYIRTVAQTPAPPVAPGTATVPSPTPVP
jgi:ABC-type multidrug transport system fused ATPase/permease subunit